MLLLFTGGCAFSDILGDLVCDEVFGGSALFVASILVPQPLQNFCPGLSSLPQFGQITFDSDSVFSDTGSADSIFAPHNPEPFEREPEVKYKKPTAKRLKNLKVKSFKIKGSNLRKSDFFDVQIDGQLITD